MQGRRISGVPIVSKIRKTELCTMRRVTDQKRTTRMPGADRQIYEARLLRVLSYIYDHPDGDLSSRRGGRRGVHVAPSLASRLPGDDG